MTQGAGQGLDRGRYDGVVMPARAMCSVMQRCREAPEGSLALSQCLFILHGVLNMDNVPSATAIKI